MDISPSPRKRARIHFSGTNENASGSNDLNIPVSRFQGNNRHELEIKLIIAQKRIQYLSGIIEARYGTKHDNGRFYNM